MNNTTAAALDARQVLVTLTHAIIDGTSTRLIVSMSTETGSEASTSTSVLVTRTSSSSAVSSATQRRQTSSLIPAVPPVITSIDPDDTDFDSPGQNAGEEEAIAGSLEGPDRGTAVGIVVGALAGMALLVGVSIVLYKYWHRRRRKQTMQPAQERDFEKLAADSWPLPANS